jgi:hypothetical protein
MNSNVGAPFFTDFDIKVELDWQMSRAEKYCMINLLQSLKPEVAIEIGTFKGGSLQVINEYSNKIYSIDISDAPKKFLQEKFNKVDFRVGESHLIINTIFKEIEDKKEKLEFILVDGDHSKIGVKKDLESILAYPHKNKITILLHDSFNPQSRAGIKSLKYSNYPNVSYVELDYITGSFWHNKSYREMWGGFAMIVIDPNKQGETLQLSSQEHLFRRAYLSSIHLIKDPFHFFWKKRLMSLE